MVKKIQKAQVIFLLFLSPALPVSPAWGGVKREAPAYKLPYRPRWVSVVKKGRLFKYQRREFSSPRVKGELVFLGADNGNFYAMKKKNGRKVWRFAGRGSINSAPGFDEKNVYFGDDKGILYALEGATGKKIWEAELNSEILTAPVTHGAVVYAATVEGKIAALRSDDGSPLWEREHPATPMKMTIRGNAPLVVDGEGRLYAGFADGTFWALASRDGKILWEKKMGPERGFADVDTAPLLMGGRIYLATFDGPLLALDRKSGKTLWSADIGSAAPMLASDEILYISGSHGSLVAVRQKDGSRVWETPVGRGALTAPVLYKDVLAVGLSRATMNFIDAKTGRMMYRRFAKKGISSDPLLVEDRLYYFSNGGRLYSLKMVN